MSKTTLAVMILVGLAANGAWIWSDYTTWSAWGWIVVALLTPIFGATLVRT